MRVCIIAISSFWIDAYLAHGKCQSTSVLPAAAVAVAVAVAAAADHPLSVLSPSPVHIFPFTLLKL